MEQQEQSNVEQQVQAETEQLTVEQQLQRSEENYKLLVEENSKLIEENDKLTSEKEKLQATVNRLQSSADKSDTYLNQLVAMKNDFESYKRRMRFNEENSKSQGIASAVERIFPIIDTFGMAKKHLSDDNLKAFEMVEEQFVKVLTELGVVKMDVMGKTFDAMMMNALAKVPAEEGKQDIVVEVYKDGYMLGDKVLRYAEVIVGQ